MGLHVRCTSHIFASQVVFYTIGFLNLVSVVGLYFAKADSRCVLMESCMLQLFVFVVLLGQVPDKLYAAGLQNGQCLTPPMTPLRMFN